MDKSSSKSIAQELSAMPVIVAALGYLVDMYDLFLFSIVRVPSLKSLNLSSESILNDGILLLNLQMAGLLVGGIFWGILGDKKGRLSVLFGSILIYSLMVSFINVKKLYPPFLYTVLYCNHTTRAVAITKNKST